MLKKHLNIKGFTLIELLIVVAIIGVLAVVGVVAYSGVTSGLNDTRKKSDIEAIMKAYETKRLQTGSYGSGLIESSYFVSGAMPKTPEGGDYTILRDTVTTGVSVCAVIGNGQPCDQNSSTCVCRSVAQEYPPTPSGQNTEYLTNSGLIGQSSPSPSPSQSPSPTPTPLGSNLLTNNTFDTNLTGWGCNLSNACLYDAGSARLTRDKVTNGWNSWGDALYRILGSTSSGSYCFSASIRKQTTDMGGDMHIQGPSASNPSVTKYSNSINLVTVTTTQWTQVQGIVVKGSDWSADSNLALVVNGSNNTNGQTIWVDNISLKPGATAGNCPTLP